MRDVLISDICNLTLDFDRRVDGSQGSLGGYCFGKTPFSIRFNDPGLLVSAARLRPTDGEVVLVGREWQELRPDSKDTRRERGAPKLPSWEDFKID